DYASIRAHPNASDLLQLQVRYRLGRDKAAPSDIAGIARVLLAKEVGPHHGMDAVGPHENIPLEGGPVGNCDRNTICILVKSDDFRAEAKSLLVQGIKQHAEQL